MNDSASKYTCSTRTVRRRVKAAVEEHLRSAAVHCRTTDSTECDDVHVSMEVTEMQHETCVSEVGTENMYDHADEAEGASDDEYVDCVSELVLDEDIFCDEVPSESDGSDSFDYESESDSNCVRARIAAWATSFNISQVALAALLSILRHSGLDLPKDPRTLQSTPRHVDVEHIAGGSYHHFGIVNCLSCKLQSMAHKTLQKTLTLNINVDGLPLFRSSSKQLWPILAMVQEFGKMKPLLIGVFCGSSKPTSVHEFLQHFVDEMKSLLKLGFDFQGTHYAVSLGAFICDAPARAFIKCIKGHSGYSSCERCTQEGVYNNGRMTFPEFEAAKRTDEHFRRMISEEHHTSVSPLLELGVGCVSQFPLDYMHLVCLGVVRRLILLWLKGPLMCRLHTQSVKNISDKLIKFQNHMPKEVSRKPRSLLEVMQWKATEFRQFLLYTGPVTLLGEIKNDMYRNFMLLSVSMRILLTPSICTQYCDYAEQLLSMFVKNFASLYGKSLLVYNVHSLLHLPQDVRKYGALDSVSAFPFESFLGKLKKKVRKPHNPISQIVNRVHEENQQIDATVRDDNVSPLKKLHHNGPLPSGMSTCEQYCHYLRTDTFVSCSEGNNCFEICGNAALIRNILLTQHGEVYVVYDCFEVSESFFTYPLNSSCLGIRQVSKLVGQLRVASIEDVKQKLVIVPLQNNFVLLPLLHCDEANIL